MLDPANADFVESIRSGTCPRELDPLDPSKHVSPAVLLLTFSVSCGRPHIAESWTVWRVPPNASLFAWTLWDQSGPQQPRCFRKRRPWWPDPEVHAVWPCWACRGGAVLKLPPGLWPMLLQLPSGSRAAYSGATDAPPHLWSQVTVNLVRNATDYVKPKYVAFGGQGQTLAGGFLPAQHVCPCLPALLHAADSPSRACGRPISVMGLRNAWVSFCSQPPGAWQVLAELLGSATGIVRANRYCLAWRQGVQCQSA